MKRIGDLIGKKGMEVLVSAAKKRTEQQIQGWLWAVLYQYSSARLTTASAYLSGSADRVHSVSVQCRNHHGTHEGQEAIRAKFRHMSLLNLHALLRPREADRRGRSFTG